MRISDWSSDVCSSDLFAKATAQVEGEDLMPPRQPGLPAPHCLARQAGPGGAAAQRQPPQHRQQGTLLHGPVVPAPGREAAGQPGAGMAAAGAAVARYRYRMQRLDRWRPPIGFADIASMTPEPAKPAVWAGGGPIVLRGVANGVQVLS